MFSSKNLRQTPFFLSSFFLVFSTSCGSDSSNTADKIENGGRNLLRASDVVGDWKSTCLNDEGFKTRSDVQLKFKPDSFSRDVAVYAADKCESPIIAVKYWGSYSIGSSDDFAADVNPVEYNMNKVTITPLSDSGVLLLKASLFCGNTNWVVNQELDLTSEASKAGCFLNDLPSKEYDIIKVTNNQMQTGKVGIQQAPLAPEKRPTELSPIFFTRQ